MKLLAIETATEACSVAVHVDGTVIERFEIAPRKHAELTLPWAGELLAQAGIGRRQLDAVAISRGPGAFTGVRLAIAIAQGIALAIDRPLLAVSTLQALALRAPAQAHQVLAAIDARMGEVYTGRFVQRDGQWVGVDDEAVLPPAQVSLAGEWFGVGTGFAAEQGALVQACGSALTGFDAQALPHAADVATLAVAAWQRGEAIAPELVEPAYLRNNVALTIAEQQALREARA
jgi:tRNA threonylcarbamoyladenosine biosynthesis protein TsaB